MTSKVFQTQIKVRSEHIDHFEHVNNVQYVKWVNHAAHLHWEQETSTQQREKYAWMVTRHEIDYKHQAFLEDELILKTWVDAFTYVVSIRRVEIFNKTSGKICVQAKSKWCFLDKSTKKLMRIPDAIKQPYIATQDV